MSGPKAPGKILVAGDVHGNGDHFRYLVDTAISGGCQTIVQLGDFGFWTHRRAGRKFLDSAAGMLALSDLECVFIDGNHECFELLWREYGSEGFVEVRPRLWYAARGHRWAWQGATFLALGGAYSTEAETRTPGESWWPEETASIDAGVEAHLAAAGRAAVRLAQQVQPGLVVLDLSLPDVYGTELAKILWDVPVIVISALPTHAVAQDAWSIGALDYFTKPFEIDELVAAVQNALVATHEK